jgi:hypothetical protein
MRPLPSPLTDGGSFPSSLKTYFNAYNTAVKDRSYGDEDAATQVSEANDSFLHPRTALPLDIACWSVSADSPDLHLGPVHVGNDAILFDSGCVGLTNNTVPTNTMATHVYYFLVTPGSFSCKTSDFLQSENASGWLQDLGGDDDELVSGSEEELISISRAAKYWRDSQTDDPLFPLMPPGVQNSAWDYALRFVAFPGCACSSNFSNSAIKIKVETVDLDEFSSSNQQTNGNSVSNGCIGTSERFIQSIEDLSARVSIMSLGDKFGILTGGGCTPSCPSGTLHFDVASGSQVDSPESILSAMNSQVSKDSISVDCPSCGSTSVEIPHDVAKMIVENGCYTLVKNTTENPCCAPTSVGGADRESYQIIPNFSSPICSALKDEVVCAPSCCLVVGTVVSTTAGNKPIEEVRPGDILMSRRPVSPSRELDIPITSPEIRDSWPQDSTFVDHLVVVSEVAAGFEESYLVINKVLKLTAEHAMPVMRDGHISYRSIRGIEFGDMVMTAEGMCQMVYSIEKPNETVATISLSTGGGNLYLADGYLVHNSDAGFIDSGFDFGGAAGLSNASGVDEISALERFAMLRSKIKVDV